MANILILGGGFAGVIAAQSLAKRVASEHQITLLSRTNHFLFYPGLVRFAFGKSSIEDISYDLRGTLLDARVRFVQGEIARIDPESRRVIVAHGQVTGDLHYDYLLIALGRRLATENVTGFFEYAHHVLTLDAAERFGSAANSFTEGRAVIGQCAGARLPVPVYETAFALARRLASRGSPGATRITILSPDPPGLQFGDGRFTEALRSALERHQIEFLPDFRVQSIAPGVVLSVDGHAINYSLLMLLPPFRGPGAATGLGATDAEGYLTVSRTMKVEGVERVYAAGDCVNFEGPKLAHMAVQQAEIAAHNLVNELEGKPADETYSHEVMMVLDEGGDETIFLERALWEDKPTKVRQGLFWSWAKRVHDRYWKYRHL
ncbi:MAG TPA: FAD-dependent oxidoreductase [Pyrinomonadaceae bacterium]|nr:FAD-dependent oxidoreductase [Pyrinomonadaceae bacterium]